MTSRSFLLGSAIVVAAVALAGCAQKGGKLANVDDERLVAGSPDGADWLSYGRTMDEQRFSPLTQVNDQNVGQLGLAWSSDLDTARGQEATPIVVDGIMYVSTAWSMVKAYDATNGKKLWEVRGGQPDDALFSPEDMTVLTDGTLAVLENISNRVQLFEPAGKLRASLDLA